LTAAIPASDIATAGTAQVTVANPNNIVSSASTFTIASPVSFTLTVSRSGPGTITGPGINCGADCSDAYPAGTSVQLTATPNRSARLAGWSGACAAAGTAPTCTVT